MTEGEKGLETDRRQSSEQSLKKRAGVQSAGSNLVGQFYIYLKH
jgi:hypothetical protein